MRVVLDTNVFISALMFGGLPGALLDLARIKSFETLISPALLDELQDKLCGKFAVASTDAALILEKIAEFAHLVSPTELLQVIAQDPDDDRVLECAVSGHADVIVSRTTPSTHPVETTGHCDRRNNGGLTPCNALRWPSKHGRACIA